MKDELMQKVANEYLASAEGSDAARLRFVMGLWETQSLVVPERTGFAAPTAEQAQASLVSGQPLFAQYTPQLDAEEYLQSVSRMVAYVVESAVLDTEQSRALMEADLSEALTDHEIGEAARAPEAWIARVSESVAKLAGGSITRATAAFVLQSALVPFLVGPAAEAITSFGSVDPHVWTSGDCPVCGASATMGRVGESTKLQGAQRVLWCGSCHAEWGYDRIRCVRCGCRNADKLRYTYIEGDPAHRLHLCDECHGYARFVFEDDLKKAVAMPVEDAVTAPLDALAVQQGYSATGDGGTGAC